MSKLGGVMCLTLPMTLALVALVGCGDEDTEQETTAPDGVDCVMEAVPATEVEVSGDLSADEQAMVEWALSRFEEADLKLPPMIEVGFDPTRVACRGFVGFCEPGADLPSICICDEAGESAFRIMNREMALLHELAHLWYAAAQPQPDIASIVGGEDDGSAGAAWADRSVERMAIVITWGLMDQLRRPVPSATPCVELYRQFFELTGHRPLGPLEGICIPDNIPKVRRVAVVGRSAVESVVVALAEVVVGSEPSVLSGFGSMVEDDGESDGGSGVVGGSAPLSVNEVHAVEMDAKARTKTMLVTVAVGFQA